MQRLNKAGIAFSDNGLSLIELLVGIAILSILTALAVPALAQFFARNQLTGYTNDLVTSLNLARNEAISRSRAVSVCPTNNGTACGNNLWAEGWIVFDDLNGNGALDLTDTPLNINYLNDQFGQITNNATANVRQVITYRRDGTVESIPLGNTGTFNIAHPESNVSTQLDLRFTGDIKVTRIN